MARLPTGLVLCACAFFHRVTASASFTNPTGDDFGTTYNVGQQINIAWQGAENFTALSLGLRQTATQAIYWIVGGPNASPSGYTSSSYLWSIALGSGESLSLGDEFSFWLIDGDYAIQIYGTQFYLRDPSATTSSTSKSIATPSATSTPTGSSTTPVPTPDTSSSFSAGAKAGIAVGALAAFCLGLGLAYYFFRRRERSGIAGPPSQPNSEYVHHNEVKAYQPVITDQHTYYGQGELPGDQPSATVHEVP